MIFIGVGLVVAIGLALIINGDAGSLIGLEQNQTVRLVALVGILILVAGGAFGRRQRLGEMLGNLALWCGIFAIVIVGYTFRAELGQIGSRVLAEVSPGAAVVDVSGAKATFRRSFGGAFRVNTEINGHRAALIFDTGASAVVLTQADAKSAGIDVRNLRYSVPVRTANGTGMAAAVILDRVKVGDITRRKVRAFVADDGALETSLLGMTFLETLSGFSVQNDSLVLTD